MLKSSNLIVTEIEHLSTDQYPFWQVRWIGELGINYQTEELTAKVHLVPISKIDRLELEGQSKGLIYNNSFDFSNEKIITVGVGYLPLLNIGSIFYNGKFYCNPNYITKTFKIDVTEQTQKIISVRDSWNYLIKENEIKKWYLPNGQFRGSYLTGNCVLIEIPDEFNNQVDLLSPPFQYFHWLREIFSDHDLLKQSKKADTNHSPMDLTKYGVKPRYSGLIIPCMEMLAYYYTVSSKMFQHLLADSLIIQPNRIFNEKKTIKPSPGVRGHLRLTKHIPFIDAPVVAPIAFDNYANQQAKNIFLSRLKNRDKGTDVVDVKFPFINKTTVLKVHGIPILSGTKVFFLVYRIDSCSQMPLFRDFGVWRDNMRGKDKDQIKENQKAMESDQSKDHFESDKSDEINRTEEIHVGIRDRRINKIITTVNPSKFRQVINIPHPRNRFSCNEKEIWDIEPDERTLKKIRNKVKLEYIFTKQDFEQFSTARAKGNLKTTKAIIEAKKPSTLNSKYREQPKSNDPLPGGDSLFSDIVTLINRGSNVKAKQILISNDLDKDYEYKIVENVFPQNFSGEFFDWTNDTFDEEPHSTLIAELNLKDKHFAYLFEIIPVRESSNIEKRQYKMLLVYDIKKFAKLDNSDLFQVLVACAKNEGKWLAADNLTHLGRNVFKHTSKTISRYVERIFEPLIPIGWSSLSEPRSL